MYFAFILFFFLNQVLAQINQELIKTETKKDNLVLYWGQGDFGEKKLSYYCDQEGISIIVLGFIVDFIGGPKKSPIINLADNCNDVENCVDAAKDIQYCQKKGVKVLMSVGGAAGKYHNQSWDPDLFAWWLWNKFLGGDDRTVARPFGDVVLDGIDYDPEEMDGEGYDRHIDTLRQLFKTQYPPRQYLITAAPQCPDLDYYNKNALYTILHPSPKYDAYPDMVFVQFYNNYCSASAHRKGSSDFNFDEWESWAEDSTKGRTKIMLGVLGRENHMDTGYVNYEKLTTILDDIRKSPHFGGVMIWDAGYAYANIIPYFSRLTYGQAIAKYLQKLTNLRPSLLESLDLVVQEHQAPVMIPVLQDPAMPCEGQPFVLLQPVNIQILAESLGTPSDVINQRFMDLGVSDEIIQAGSYLCLVSEKISLGYVYNAVSN
ncbi:unnamed protein product [Rhizopus stolonifer]